MAAGQCHQTNFQSFTKNFMRIFWKLTILAFHAGHVDPHAPGTGGTLPLVPPTVPSRTLRLRVLHSPVREPPQKI